MEHGWVIYIPLMEEYLRISEIRAPILLSVSVSIVTSKLTTVKTVAIVPVMHVLSPNPNSIKSTWVSVVRNAQSKQNKIY